MESTSIETKPAALPSPVLKETEGFGRNIKKYDIQDESGARMGRLDLVYHSRNKTVELGIVEIDQSKQGQGYGKAIYEQIPSLPSPDGQKYTFRSSKDIKESAVRVWESLVRDGKAVKKEDGAYEMVLTEA